MNKYLSITVNLINAFLITLLLIKIKNIDSDKGITLLYFYYPILLGINFFLGVVSAFFKKDFSRVFFYACVILLIALIPVILIASTFK